MSKKSRKTSIQGTYALCLTIGFIVGMGLGLILESVLITTILGVLAGTSAAYYLSHLKPRANKNHPR
jgi:hypothetical protein